MNCRDIQTALYYRAMGRRRIMAPNICLLIGEQDWLEVTGAGYAYEYEIKLTKADFRKDFEKVGRVVIDHTVPWPHKRREIAKHAILSGVELPGRHTLPRRFYFVLPEGVVAVSDVPSHCGVIVASKRTSARHNGYRGPLLKTVREAPAIVGAKKLSEKQMGKIAASLGWRFFSVWTQQYREKQEA